MLNVFKSSAAIAATAVLVAQGILLYNAERPEALPPLVALSGMPSTLGSWTVMQEGVIDQQTREALRADDLLSRYYGNGRAGANLFVAAFRSQRNGKAPHSPKNCLPGNGWAPLTSGEYTVDTGALGPITVNRYVVAYGDNRSLVMYWYQSRDRAVASEYKAKFWVAMDAMRLNRTDTALVRVVIPIANRDEDAATRTAQDFIRAFFPALREHLPT